MLHVIFVALLITGVESQGLLGSLLGTNQVTCDEDCETTVTGALIDMGDLLQKKDPYKLPFPVLPPLSDCKLVGFGKVRLAGKACVGKVGIFKAQLMDFGFDEAGLSCDLLVLDGFKLTKGKLGLKWKNARLKVGIKESFGMIANDQTKVSCDKPPCSIDAKDLEVSCPGPGILQTTCDTLKGTILKNLMQKAMEMSFPIIMAGEVNKNKKMAERVLCDLDDE